MWQLQKYQLGLQAQVRVSKTRKHHQHAWGRFWIGGDNFGQDFMLLCRILQFVTNYAVLTVHMNQQARL